MAAIADELRDLISLVAGEDVDIPAAGDSSLRELGFTSVQLLRLLVGIQDRFGVIWGDDVPEHVIASVDAMAQYIEQNSKG